MTDNTIIRKDGATVGHLQESLATVDDSGTMNIPTGQTYNINGSPHAHAGGSAYYPTRAGMFHYESKVTVGNALTFTVTQLASQAPLYAAYSWQNTPANGDTFTQSFMLKAGTYTLNVLGAHATSHGKIDWYIDDVLVISGQDWYGTAADNIKKSVGSITVTGSGRHVLKGVINGKNASSSDYRMILTRYWFEPASDTSEV